MRGHDRALHPLRLVAASFLLSVGADDDYVSPDRLPAITALSLVAVALRIARARIHDQARPV